MYRSGFNVGQKNNGAYAIVHPIIASEIYLLLLSNTNALLLAIIIEIK